jgi:hypothetical protein
MTMVNMKLSVCVVLTVLTASSAFWGCEKRGSADFSSSIDFTDPNAIRRSGALGVYEDGWVGPEAEIALDNAGHSAALLLDGTNVETKLRDESLSIVLLVGEDTLRVVTIAAVGDFRESVFLPQDLASSDTLELRLIASKSFVPSKLGTSRDDRALSFRLRRIALLSREGIRQYLPGSFKFPRAAENDPNLQGIFSDGWMSDSAVVTLYNPDSSAMVEIRGLVPGNVFHGVSTLDVLYAGHLVVRNQVRANFQVKFQLPGDARGSSKLRLTLRPNGTFVPAVLGTSADSRTLSYQLQYVGLK